jgi:hypothetical protein
MSYTSFTPNRAVIGGLVYFAEKTNATVDGVPVSETAIPTLSGFDNFFIGCTQTIGLEKTEKVTTYLCPNTKADGGGYNEIEDTRVTGNFLNFQTAQVIEPTMRLALGADTPMLSGVAFKPFSAERNEAYGWLNVKLVVEGGLSDVDFKVWGKLKLASQPTFTDEFYHPEYRFQVLKNSLNTAIYNF